MTTITDSQLRRTRRLRANSLPTIHISPQMLQHTRLPFIAWHLPIQHPPADTRALSWCRIHIWARSCTAPAIRRICIMRHCAHEYPHRPRLSHVHATVRSTNVHCCAEREAHLAHASAHQPHAAPPSSSSIPVGIVCLACAHVRTEYALAWHCGAPSTALRQPPPLAAPPPMDEDERIGAPHAPRPWGMAVLNTSARVSRDVVAPHTVRRGCDCTPAAAPHSPTLSARCVSGSASPPQSKSG